MTSIFKVLWPYNNAFVDKIVQWESLSTEADKFM